MVLFLLSTANPTTPPFPDSFRWQVKFAPTNNADSLVTDVHMHEAATDDILLTLPVSVRRMTTSDPDLFAWEVSSIFSLRPFQGTSYRGSVPFDLLYEFVSSDGTYIDVHTVAHPAGARGRVAVTSSRNWNTDICDD